MIEHCRALAMQNEQETHYYTSVSGQRRVCAHVHTRNKQFTMLKLPFGAIPTRPFIVACDL